MSWAEPATILAALTPVLRSRVESSSNTAAILRISLCERGGEEYGQGEGREVFIISQEALVGLERVQGPHKDCTIL